MLAEGCFSNDLKSIILSMKIEDGNGILIDQKSRSINIENGLVSENNQKINGVIIPSIDLAAGPNLFLFEDVAGDVKLLSDK